MSTTLYFRSVDMKWSVDRRSWHKSPELALARRDVVAYERLRPIGAVPIHGSDWYVYEGNCPETGRLRRIRVEAACDSRLLAITGKIPTRPAPVTNAWDIYPADGYALLGAYPLAGFYSQTPQFTLRDLRSLYRDGRLRWSFYDPYQYESLDPLLMGVEVEGAWCASDVPHRASLGSDASLRYSRGMVGELGEMRSMIMTPQSLLGWLTLLAARCTWEVNSTCGGHIHFSRPSWRYLEDIEGLPLDGFIGDLIQFFRERSPGYASRLEGRRRNGYCRSVRWSDALQRAHEGRAERYRAWNLEAYPEKGVEFRLPPGITMRNATREYAYLVALLARRLGEQNLVPSWVRIIPSWGRDYVIEEVN